MLLPFVCRRRGEAEEAQEAQSKDAPSFNATRARPRRQARNQGLKYLVPGAGTGPAPVITIMMNRSVWKRYPVFPIKEYYGMLAECWWNAGGMLAEC